MLAWALPKVSPVRVWHRVKACPSALRQISGGPSCRLQTVCADTTHNFGDYYANREGEDKKHHCLALAGVARKLMGVCSSPHEGAAPLGDHAF